MSMKRLSVVLFFVPLIAYAQLVLPGFDGAVRMSIEPSYPHPQETATVTLESTLIDLSHADIVWYVDGKRVPGSATSLPVALSAAGSRTSVSAQITTAEGSILGADTTITPTSIDLLYESDTYVPPFYAGRSLPSAGSTLRVQALVHFVRPDGSEVKPSDITYTWRRDGRVLGSVSGRGRDTLSTDAPYLYGSSVIALDAESVDGSFHGNASVTVRSVEPVLRLYQDHPLFGLRLDQAVASTSRFVEREMTFAAIPFFGAFRTPTDPSLSYEWTVDGSHVDSSAAAPHELTLGAPEGGSAALAVDVSQGSNIFFGASGRWRIIFDTAPRTNELFGTH